MCFFFKFRSIFGNKLFFDPILRVAVRVGTGGDVPHTREDLKGTWVPNSSGGTRKSTKLTSKYVLWGKTKKAKKVIRQL